MGGWAEVMSEKVCFIFLVSVIIKVGLEGKVVVLKLEDLEWYF